MFFILLFHLAKNLSFNKIKIYLKIISLLIFSFILYVEFQSVDYDGTFDRLYGGYYYNEGLDYRMTQFFVILKIFYEFPLGAGFGYYTPNYLTYGEYPKPYLLELDLFNFFSKIGLLVSFFYVFILFQIYIKLKNTINHKNNGLTAFYIGIISLMIYSLGQAAHGGYLYWVVFSIFYSTLILYNKSYHNPSYVTT